MQVTRGAATRAHNFPPADTPPTVYISVARFTPYSEFAEKGARAMTHPDLRWGSCDLKTLQPAANVLAVAGGERARNVRGDADSGRGRHRRHRRQISSGSSTDPCDAPVRQSHPSRDHAGRCSASFATALDIELDETPIKESEIPKLSQSFLTGTTTDVMPVVELDDKPIGKGNPGELTRKLQRVLQESLALGGD